MIHAVLIDDEINGLKSLELLLEGLKDRVKVVGTTTDALQGIEMINIYRPDIVFLDISMPNLDGFEVLERLTFKNFDLVFTTAYRKFALRALKLGAMDYLLKPVDRKELYATVNRIADKIVAGQTKPDIYGILKQFNETNKMRILIPSRKTTEYVNPSDIVYIEANSNTSLVSLTNDQIIEVTTNLKGFEQQLCSREIGFMRVHHSYIINIDYVTRYIKDDGGFATLRGKKTIPVSRPKKEEFLKAINFKA